jgi:CheY-like chemotaxis protein
MRPKKRILLIDTNEDRQAVLRFLFVTHAYHVISAGSADEARQLIATEDPELIVCAYPLAGADADTLLDQLRQVIPFTPSLLLYQGKGPGPQLGKADAVVPQSISRVELLERTKLMSARKRGPRKQVASISVADLAARRTA